MGEPKQPTHEEPHIKNPVISEPEPVDIPEVTGDFDDVLKMTVYNLVTGKKHFSIKNHV